MKRPNGQTLLLIFLFVLITGVSVALIALRMRPSAEAESRRGQDLIAISMLPEAEDAYRQAIRINPNYAPAYRGLAELATARGDSKTAIEQWRELIKRDPKSEHAFCRLGQAEALSGLEVFALEDGKKELQNDPSCPRAHLLLGILYARQNASKLALDHLEIAAKANPNVPQIQLVFGHVLALVGDYDRAETVLKTALANSSGQPEPFLWLGYVYSHRVASLENSRQAKNYLRKALAIDPESAEANFEYGRLLARERRNADALPYLKKAVARKRHYIAALQNLSQTATALGLKAEAATVLQTFERESKWSEREKALLKQYVAKPNDLETKMELANLELEREEPEAAKIFLLSAQKNAPDDPRIAIALKRAEIIGAGRTGGVPQKDTMQDALTSGKKGN